MNVQPTLGSVDLVPATTLWATTLACARLSTCRSMEETTVWVSWEILSVLVSHSLSYLKINR